MINEKYEISLWEDVWTPGTIQESIPDHFEERKICVIGSNDITASCRAYDPNLVENVDGTNKFTFKMLINCRDDTYEELIQQFVVRANEGTQPFYTQDVIPYVFSHIEFVRNEYKNPFLSLMTNERKIKVLWKGKWYDLLIKNCQEDSSQGTITYTCTDVFINELSKTGLDIVLDNELENNYGNVTTLAQAVLDGTDWQVDQARSDVIQQLREESVFEVLTTHDITAYNESVPFMAVDPRDLPDEFSHPGQPNITYYEFLNNQYQLTQDSEPIEGKTYYLKNTISIPSNSKILVFYTQIQDAYNRWLTGKTPDRYFQFAYAAEYEREGSSQLVVNADNYSLPYVEYEFSISGEGTINEEIEVKLNFVNVSDSTRFANFVMWQTTGSTQVSDKYRANRLVRSQKTIFDPLTKKYCKIYKACVDGEDFARDNIIYGYQETQYESPIAVFNLIVNSKSFTSTDGWSGENLVIKIWSPTGQSADLQSFLKLSTVENGQNIYNAGLRYNSNYIPDGFIQGQKYILRYKARYHNSQDNIPGSYYGDVNTNKVITPHITNYTYNNSKIIENPNGEEYFSYKFLRYSNDNWNEWGLTCIKTISRASIYSDMLGLFLEMQKLGLPLWLEEIQLFPFIPSGEDGHLCPGEMSASPIVNNIYTYYNHTQSAGVLNVEEVPYIWSSTSDLPISLANIIQPVYNENFEKLLTVSAKQSNRYNLLKTLTEKFECYINFEIKHNQSTGELIYVRGIPQKFVFFKKDNGQQSGIGFVYGIDLKTIQRTIQSDQIVTKMVVAPNNNEFAKNGFCTITRSKENFAGVNFIINFDYYISQGLLDEDWTRSQLRRYYTSLNTFNTIYLNKSEEQRNLKDILTNTRAQVTVWEATKNNAILQQENLWNELSQLTGGAIKNWDDYNAYISDPVHADDYSIISRGQAIVSLQQLEIDASNALGGVEISIEHLQQQIDDLQSDINNELDAISFAHREFYHKFSRFIQEGSWKDDTYIDDDLYYLDALKASREASVPKVSYNISVIRVSALEDFKSKVFHLGDITYIEDKEFFGYHYIDGVKTPYREKVTISEISSFFEEPEKDNFKVQNYKTEFQDLFQRINYTTNAFQYSSDGYDRINSISTGNGLIDADVLQDSISAAKVPIHFGSDLVTQDGNGITISDVARANQQTRITSGGIFTTQDGGETWKNAVNAKGVSVEALAPGVLDLERVSVADSAGKVKITKDGIAMKNLKAVDSNNGGLYYNSDGDLSGYFNSINIEAKVNTQDFETIENRLTIDNDNIQHYTCIGQACSFDGNITFKSTDGIVLQPHRGSVGRININAENIDLITDRIGNYESGDKKNKINFIGLHDSKQAMVTIDFDNLVMSCQWYDGDALRTSSLDLKTFTAITQNSGNSIV